MSDKRNAWPEVRSSSRARWALQPLATRQGRRHPDRYGEHPAYVLACQNPGAHEHRGGSCRAHHLPRTGLWPMAGGVPRTHSRPTSCRSPDRDQTLTLAERCPARESTKCCAFITRSSPSMRADFLCRAGTPSHAMTCRLSRYASRQYDTPYQAISA